MNAVVKVVPRPPTPQQAKARALTARRRLAKAGMGLSLGVLVWSAMRRGRVVMRYHTLAGVALLGFAAWHMTLYRPRDRTLDE